MVWLCPHHVHVVSHPRSALGREQLVSATKTSSVSRKPVYLLVRLLKAQNGSNPEKNGTKTILVSLEAEFFVEQHIQNPLKSAPGKSC